LKADPKGVLTGIHFMDGNFAACEGALAAGCRFVAGYPITPSTEVVEAFAARIPTVGDGMFIQMEDELASSIAIQGAVWAGKKAMTVTSGPGISLMQEHIGLAATYEIPLVFIDVMRGGPSTGLPTLPAQGDLMQIKWGSHGDYEIIAIATSSPQECFDLAIKAFNLAEQYRCPVFLLLDEVVGHMLEKVVIPEADEIEIQERLWTKKAPGEYWPYDPEFGMMPGMIKVGDGYNIHTTGLTHDHRGYPSLNAETQKVMVGRMIDKIKNNVDKIIDYEDYRMDDAEIVVFAFGVTTRVAKRAVDDARKKGIKAGMVKFIVVWPLPEDYIIELAKKSKAFIMAEGNMGQVVYEIERLAAGNCPTTLVPHAGGGVHKPASIENAILEAAK